MKHNYIKVEGLKEQVIFNSTGKTKFAVGDKVALIVTNVDESARGPLFACDVRH